MSASPAFSLPIRVYWEDTDAGGVVYHAAYLCFLERARTEWLRTLGVSQQQLRERDDVVFAVRGMALEFFAPARLDDALAVEVRIVEVGRASVSFQQRIVRPSDERVLLEARVRVACLMASTFRPRALPEALKHEFLKHSINEVC
ncbi:tol-pal system-associated acyl-CoA thioesterase [Xanthomonadaceae bacterium XH05]|nr:tol-pal system-associated acyl-CoA thioesterase [Xanthomonadaceae bacterium XH05]